jgi:hypothetical protein
LTWDDQDAGATHRLLRRSRGDSTSAPLRIGIGDDRVLDSHRLWTNGEPFLAMDADLRPAWRGFSNDQFEQVVELGYVAVNPSAFRPSA